MRVVLYAATVGLWLLGCNAKINEKGNSTAPDSEETTDADAEDADSPEETPTDAETTVSVETYEVAEDEVVELTSDTTIIASGSVTIEGELSAPAGSDFSITIEAAGDVVISGSVQAGAAAGAAGGDIGISAGGDITISGMLEAGGADQGGGSVVLESSSGTVSIAGGSLIRAGDGGDGTSEDTWEAAAGWDGGSITLVGVTTIDASAILQLGAGGSGKDIVVTGDELLAVDAPIEFQNRGGNAGVLTADDSAIAQLTADNLIGGAGGDAGAVYFGIDTNGVSTWPEGDIPKDEDPGCGSGIETCGITGAPGGTGSGADGGPGGPVHVHGRASWNPYFDGQTVVATGGQGGYCYSSSSKKCSAGAGGAAEAEGGQGAAGTAAHSNASHGGSATAVGGRGGVASWISLSEWTVERALSGAANAIGGAGGNGLSGCEPAVVLGGNGGDGGKADALSSPEQPFYATALGGSGGDGGSGISPGTAGAGGVATAAGDPATDDDGLSGSPGSACYESTLTLTFSSADAVSIPVGTQSEPITIALEVDVGSVTVTGLELTFSGQPDLIESVTLGAEPCTVAGVDISCPAALSITAGTPEMMNLFVTIASDAPVDADIALTLFTATGDTDFIVGTLPIVQITTAPAKATNIALSGASACFAGETTPLTATATYSDGTSGTASVDWAIDAASAAVASVSSSGLVTCKTAGSATITASLEGSSDTHQVTVSPVPTVVAGSAIETACTAVVAPVANWHLENASSKSWTVKSINIKVSGAATTGEVSFLVDGVHSAEADVNGGNLVTVPLTGVTLGPNGVLSLTLQGYFAAAEAGKAMTIVTFEVTFEDPATGATVTVASNQGAATATTVEPCSSTGHLIPKTGLSSARGAGLGPGSVIIAGMVSTAATGTVGYLTHVEDVSDPGWTRYYDLNVSGQSATLELTAVAKAGDNRFIATGHLPVCIGCAEGRDALLMEVNATGAVVWAKLYSFGGKESANRIKVLDNGDLLVIGKYYVSGHYQVWAMRTNTTGTPIWAYTYDVPDDNVIVNDAALAGTQALVLSTVLTGLGEQKVGLMAIDVATGLPALGESNNTMTYSFYRDLNLDFFDPIPLILDAMTPGGVDVKTGGYYISGSISDSEGNNTRNKAWVAEVNASLQVNWATLLDGPDRDAGNAVLALTDGVLVGGSAKLLKDSTYKQDALLAKFDADGYLVWAHTYDTNDTEAFDELLFQDDLLYAAGTITDPSFLMSTWLVATDLEGNVTATGLTVGDDAPFDAYDVPFSGPDQEGTAALVTSTEQNRTLEVNVTDTTSTMVVITP